MKRVLVLIALFGQFAEARTSLYKKPAEIVAQPAAPKVESEASAETVPAVSGKQQTRRRPANARQSSPAGGRNWGMVTSGNPIVAASTAARVLADVLPGMIYPATVPMNVMAFSEGKAPVLADVRSNSGKDYVVLGEATLERASKRTTIEFKEIRERGKPEVYSLKATALSEDGSLGLKGEIHSGEGAFFLAELLSAAAAGWADSSVNRSSNAFGSPVEQPSMDTNAKKAASSAMLRSAERFSEKQKANVEYSLLEGPVLIQIMIQEQPKLSFQGGK